jgi:hypothetical protein
VFRRFLGAFARPEHPLALFLDDLQMTGRSREPFFDAQKTRAKTIASALRFAISYGSTLAVEWPRILTVWFNCSILSGFFKTVTGLICKILSSISPSG